VKGSDPSLGSKVAASFAVKEKEGMVPTISLTLSFDRCSDMLSS